MPWPVVAPNPGKKAKTMLEIDKIRQAALDLGFKDTSASKDGSTLWLSKPAAHPDDADHLMCIDIVTRSGTVFWRKDDHSLDSKTFRSADSLISWFQRPHTPITSVR